MKKIIGYVRESTQWQVTDGYNFGQVNKQPKIENISAKELLSNYNFDPVSYKVTHKKQRYRCFLGGRNENIL